MSWIVKQKYSSAIWIEMSEAWAYLRLFAEVTVYLRITSLRLKLFVLLFTLLSHYVLFTEHKRIIG
jgi:hypothetical protein